MSVLLVEIILPDSEVERLEQILPQHCRRFWRESVPGRLEKFSAVVQRRYAERLLKSLEKTFGSLQDFKAHVVRLETVLPPLTESPETELSGPEALRSPTAVERFFSRDRISIKELYSDIDESLDITPSYLLTVIFSSIIAALGMRSGQTAAVIGAMVIAPLLGPTMGIAMAATLGNAKMGGRAARTLLVGAVFAILAGFMTGLLFTIDPLVPELRNRTIVQPADIALALASGAAGVLAFSRGASLTLVGVMIAVALVPPLSATGIFLGVGNEVLAGNALFLFCVNLVCINVSGIITLLVQGLPPKQWRITGGILGLWTLILLLLALMLTGRIELGITPMASLEASAPLSQ